MHNPVLIFESDDWGAGPLEQAEALANLRSVLVKYKDQQGEHPIMTLGVVLAIADTERIRSENCNDYHAMLLTHPKFSTVHEQIRLGVEEGVFDIQLHGREHYWPSTLMRAAESTPSVRSWLMSDDLPYTEDLPSPLQTRWTDAAFLPSRFHSPAETELAVNEEAELFKECFSALPKVAVATTFVWNRDVEQAWARHGVEVIVTPGVRYTLRDERGQPSGVDKWICNADKSDAGQTYLVRDIYFEPMRGHSPGRLVEDVKKNSILGRASLVEIHRINFIRDSQIAISSLKAIDDGLEAILKNFPTIRFMTTYDLAKALASGREDVVEHCFIIRFRVWLRRVSEINEFYGYAKWTGLMLVFWVMMKLLGDEWRLSSR